MRNMRRLRRQFTKRQSIKRRMILTLAGMVLIPLFVFGGLGLIFDQQNQSPGFYDEILQNPVSTDIRSFQQQLNWAIRDNQDLFSNSDANFQLWENLKPNENFAVLISCQGSTIYLSSEWEEYKKTAIPILKKHKTPITIWKSRTNSQTVFEWGFYNSRDELIDVKLIFNFWGDRKRGVGDKDRHVLGIGALLILILTNLFLSQQLYRYIMQPLNYIKKGADKIKLGDLDFQLSSERDDELGRLTRTFEEMRFRLKESLNEQVRMEENRRELIANISHDLRTPMTAVKGYVEGLIDGVADTKEKQKKYLKTILNKTELMDALIDHLALFSRLDQEDEEYFPVLMDPGTFLQDIVNELEMDHPECRFTLTDKRTEKHLIKADRLQLCRVILNLVENGIKYNASPAIAIEIVLQESDKNLEIKVIDNGKGISEKHRDRIFERFYRIDKARTAGKGGSGLGLAICRKIIDKHSGTITLKRSDNSGSVFLVSLPLSNGRSS